MANRRIKCEKCEDIEQKKIYHEMKNRIRFYNPLQYNEAYSDYTVYGVWCTRCMGCLCVLSNIEWTLSVAGSEKKYQGVSLMSHLL